MFKRNVLWLTILVTGFIIMSGTVFLSRCTFKGPSQPIWDVIFYVPLIDKTYTMEEIVDETKELTIDSLTQNIILTVDEEIERFEVGGQIQTGGGGSAEIEIPWGAPVHWDTTYTDAFVMSDSLIIERAILDSGQIMIEVNNQTNYYVIMDLKIYSFTQNGSPLIVNIPINPGENPPTTIFLNDYKFEPRTANGKNYVDYAFDMGVQGTGSSQGGNVSVNLNISDIRFREVTGILNGIEVTIDPMDEEFDLPEEIEEFEVGSAEMELILKSEINLRADVDFLIRAVESKGPYPDPIRIQKSNVSLINDTIRIENVAGFINSHPTRIQFSGFVKLGDGITRTTLYDTSSVGGSVLFRMPLILSLPEQTTEMETDTLEIDEDIRDAIRDNLMEVAVEADVENHLPVSAEISMFFSKTIGDSTLYNHPDLIIGPIGLGPAILSGNPAVVTTPGIKQWNQTLTKEEDLTLFEQEEIYFGVQFNFQGTQGQLTKIRPSDYIHIKASGSAKVRTKIPEEDEEDKKEGGGK